MLPPVSEPRANRASPAATEAANPAFDVTPARYVTAIITERGVARAPYEESLVALSGDKVETRG